MGWELMWVFLGKLEKKNVYMMGGRRIRASCQFKLEPLGLIVIIIIIICKILQSSKRKIKEV